MVITDSDGYKFRIRDLGNSLQLRCVDPSGDYIACDLEDGDAEEIIEYLTKWVGAQQQWKDALRRQSSTD